MPHGVHAKDQTAFRFPPGVLPRLKAQAEAEGRTMTDIVVGLVAGYLDGITTDPVPAAAVSPPTDLHRVHGAFKRQHVSRHAAHREKI